MRSAASSAPRALIDASLEELSQSLRGPGLRFDIGTLSFRVAGNAPELGSQLQAVYGSFPLVEDDAWDDVSIRIERVGGWRRFLRQQVELRSVGSAPFEPFPAGHALPLLEWGCNWMIGRCCNWMLLLHAGALERDGLALLLPATPGSGKSTLTAALSHRGWRLLSDEFGAYNPSTGMIQPVLKPIALKNQSIDVIRRFCPTAHFGPVFPNTRKGTVSHVAATRDAVAKRSEAALPGAVVLPRWEAGSPTRWEPITQQALFPALAFNAFNYGLLGSLGFQSVIRLVRKCPAWQLVYSDLNDAISTLEDVWPSVVHRHLQSI